MRITLNGGTRAIRTMGWGLFFSSYLYYVGYNAAREFKGTPILGAIAGEYVSWCYNNATSFKNRCWSSVMSAICG